MRAATARSSELRREGVRRSVPLSGVIRVALVETSSRAFGAIAQLLHSELELLVVSRETRIEAAIEHSSDIDVVVLVVDDAQALERALLQGDERSSIRVVAVTDAVRPSALPSLLRAGLRAVVPSASADVQLSAAVQAAAADLTVLPEALLSQLLTANGSSAAKVTTGVLSPREREVLTLVADGLGNKSVASRLGISEHTVKTHIASVFEKLGAETRAEAVAIGVRSGTILL